MSSRSGQLYPYLPLHGSAFAVLTESSLQAFIYALGANDPVCVFATLGLSRTTLQHCGGWVQMLIMQGWTGCSLNVTCLVHSFPLCLFFFFFFFFCFQKNKEEYISPSFVPVFCFLFSYVLFLFLYSVPPFRPFCSWRNRRIFRPSKRLFFVVFVFMCL
jgi:hypothetical protein